MLNFTFYRVLEKNELKDSRIKNIAVDVTSVGAVEAVLPEKKLIILSILLDDQKKMLTYLKKLIIYLLKLCLGLLKNIV